MSLSALIPRRRSRRNILMLIALPVVLYRLYSYINSSSHSREASSSPSERDTINLPNGIAHSAESQQTCVQPKLQLWHPALKPLFVEPQPLQCNTYESNWVYTKNSRFYISNKAVKKHGEINCKMTPILRKNDFNVTRGKSISSFATGSKLLSDVFEARCVAKDGKVKKYVLSGVAPPSLEQEKTAKVKSLPESSLGLDIIMFGFDSVSRLSWIRNLPKSYKYFVEELGGVVMEGYNIVGDGTPQQLLPILTGKAETELPEARRGFEGAKPVDDHPWIWKDLKNMGYATQWGEDSARYGTFQFRMLGFNEQPVDHYMRIFYLEAEKHYHKYHRYCLGSLPRHLNMMNYMKDFVDVYESQRKFSFVFHAEYSHNGFSDLKRVDDDLLKFLKTLKEKGHLDNALFILMSDHGPRYIQMRSTEQGKYEERLPFFGIRLPEKFVASHPDVARNLQINSGRLTTPFDIHATFRDVIDFGGDKSYVGEDTTKPLPRGISLFREVPKRRSCSDAGIEPHWCSCLSRIVLTSKDSLATKAASAVVTSMNRATSSESSSCAELKLAEVQSIVKFSTSDHILKFGGNSDIHGRVPILNDNMKKSEELYQVTFRTEPGGANFEATVRHLLSSGEMTAELSAVSRINKYGKQPHCVAERLPHLRPYCYCLFQLKSQNVTLENNVKMPDRTHEEVKETDSRLPNTSSSSNNQSPHHRRKGDEVSMRKQLDKISDYLAKARNKG